MSIELIGLLTIVLGMMVFFAPVHRAFFIMVVSTLFGAGAAFSLPSLGGASVLVSSLFLVFYCLRIYMAFGEGPLLAAFAPPRAGFWLLVLTLYAVASAFFLPRLLEDATETMTVQRLVGGRSSISLIPLGPSTNNITQAFYALGGLACFGITFSYLRSAGSSERLVNAMLALAGANIAFAVLDVVTYYGGGAHLFDFVRTANYALLTDFEKAGFKRISGTFAEASAFAGYTSVLFAFVASLWLDRVRSPLTGVVAGLLLVLLVLSTSATGMVSLAVVALFLGMRSARWSLGRNPAGRPAFLASVVLVLPLAALFAVIAMPDAVEGMMGYLNEILFSKLDSQSGRERFMWNAVAYQVFLDTWGWGAGLGSARASSYLLVLLSNVGLPGTFLFVVFVSSLLLPRLGANGAELGLDEKAGRACRAGLVAGLAEALASGTVYDLGLLFYVLAAAVVALRVPVREESKAPEAVRGQGKSLAPFRGAGP
ncbi:hypothetical protein [Chelativorans sp. AA-79]|uniref:hypothetical protein n=1 Tax=Chelativorans sp. AA-79 TaxID=3028735 RepID=UPI0023F691EB|nr:hypothetical protein [Chelativorans sp. AA-79]WEX10490.1 hypothetical protein PVE73_05905 [Chelativorans sp. AA-79]